MRSKILLIVLSTLLIALSIFGYQQFLGKDSKPAPLSTSKTNLKTWESKVCGISLSYPTTFEAKTTEGELGCLFMISNKEKIQVFMLNNLTNTTWAEIIEEKKDVEVVTIAKTRGIKTKPVALGDGSIVGYYFPHKDKVITFLHPLPQGNLENEKLYDQIISSIKLTN